jgi:hypothetical protein
MIVINNIDGQKFSYNGVNYFKNFTPVAVGSEKIRILNTYDSKIELTEFPTLFSEITLDGVIYASVELLQNALLPVVFTRSTLSGGGDGSISVSNDQTFSEIQTLNFNINDFIVELAQSPTQANIKLKNNNSYSTTETLTGGTWIDGKPIYKKVIQSNTNDFINLDTFEVIHNLSIETYLKHDVVVNKIGLIGLMEKPAVYNLADCTIDSFNLIFNLDLLTSFNTNSITSETYFKKDNDIDFSLVLEYTKTTD